MQLPMVGRLCLFDSEKVINEVVKPGANVRDIGRYVCDVTDKYGYFPDANYCGHGIGSVFHSKPTISHTRSR